MTVKETGVSRETGCDNCYYIVGTKKVCVPGVMIIGSSRVYCNKSRLENSHHIFIVIFSRYHRKGVKGNSDLTAARFAAFGMESDNSLSKGLNSSLTI